MAFEVKAFPYILEILKSSHIYVKIIILCLSLVIPAVTVEYGHYGPQHPDSTWGQICATKDGRGWCNAAFAAGIISSLGAIILLQLDALIPCFSDLKVKYLAHIFNIFMEGILAFFVLITGSGVARRFTSFCKDIQDDTLSSITCEELEDDNIVNYNQFVAIPVVVLLTGVFWIAAIFAQSISIVMTRQTQAKKN